MFYLCVWLGRIKKGGASSASSASSLVHYNIKYYYCNENHDLAIARSSSSRADPGQREAFI